MMRSGIGRNASPVIISMAAITSSLASIARRILRGGKIRLSETPGSTRRWSVSRPSLWSACGVRVECVRSACGVCGVSVECVWSACGVSVECVWSVCVWSVWSECGMRVECVE